MQHPWSMLVLTWLLVGCAGSRDWRAATRADTPNAYAAYIANWPGTGRARVAARRQEELNWSQAQAADTSDAYWAYVGAHPTGPHADESRERAERLAWTEARGAATIEALTAYVVRNPTSPHFDEATVLIETAWVDAARGDDSEEAWSRYLVRYPQGQFAAEAKQRLSELAWARTVEADTKAAHERYIERFVASPHVEESEAWLESLRVGELQPVVRLLDSWQGPTMHSTVIARIRKQLETGLLADLKRDFKVRRLITEVPELEPGAEPPHPQDAFGVEAGVGLLVLDVRETRGRSFDPMGYATDIEADLVLYVPATPTPVWKQAIEATTPTKIYGSNESVLHTTAVDELGSLLRGSPFPVADHELK